MAGATASVVEPLTPPAVAVMVVVPVFTPVARPVALIVATAVADELQTAEVIVCVLPSLNVPTAANFRTTPTGMVGLAGLTAMDLSTPTVSVVEPLKEPTVAVIVVWPAPTLLTRPVGPIVVTADADELQFTEVTVWEEPSENPRVASNC